MKIIYPDGRTVEIPDWHFYAFAVLSAAGIALLAAAIFGAIHESGHIMIFRLQGMETAEVCVIGWSRKFDFRAWTIAAGEVDLMPHFLYDLAWGGDRAYYEKLYDIRR